MNDFAHVLRRADRRLTAPEPQRSRILLEIAQDLEELYHAHRESGCSEREAHARALATFDVSDESLEALEQVHTPAYARLLARYSDDDRHRAERLLLTGVALLAVAGGTYSLVVAQRMQAASPFVWPLVGLLAISAWMLARAAVGLYLNPFDPPTPGQLVPLWGLAGMSVGMGLLALLLETWRFAARVEASGVASVEVVVPYLGRAAGLLTLAAILSLAILLSLFHLRRRAVVIAQVRRAVSHLIEPHNIGAEQ